MALSSGRLILLTSVLAAVVAAAAFIRPVTSTDDNLVVRRNSGAAKVADRLTQNIASKAPAKEDTNPFAQPAATRTEGKQPPQASGSGMQMIGWAKLNDVSYGLVLTSDGERYVQAGDTVAGWHVDQIQPEKMVISHEGQVEEIKLNNRLPR